jgi:proteic killer suppression protein
LNKVVWDGKLDRQLEKIPFYIRDKFQYWVDLLEKYGLTETMKIKGFHDEALKGHLKGKRSMRLNKAYRVVYTFIDKKNGARTVEVLEVSKHEYKK